MEKSVIFVKKNLKINRDHWRLLKVRDHCHYTEEYRRAAHIICNLRYSVPKRISIAFHNGSNCDIILS